MITKQDIYERIHTDSDFSDGDAVLDITSEGRYWRTGILKRVDLAFPEGNGRTALLSWISESEPDEYEMLVRLAEALQKVRRIITYNGHSFDLPFLRNKYSAYGLISPFDGKAYCDLYTRLKSMIRFFGLPSGRLADLSRFLRLPESVRIDALRTAEAAAMCRYEDLPEGRMTTAEITQDGDRLIFLLRGEHAFPRTASVHDACFHVLFLEDKRAAVSARIENGMLRYYHTDVKNYDYLPAEGYAVHKSASSFVDRSRKEKATRETCFHLIKMSPSLISDSAKAEEYLRSVLAYLKTR